MAVDDLTISLGAAEILGLLGPNGAGKTTTLGMLAGLIAPSRGQLVVHPRVGLLTEAPGLWERLSVRSNLVTYARLHGLDDPDAAVTRSLRHVGLSDRAGDPAGQLSKGLKQRAALARALIHDPAVVLLDEPTAGLDPASARRIRDLILSLKTDGKAIVVSTHNLGEAEALCDRIAVLNTRLLALGPPDQLQQRGSDVRVRVTLEGDAAKWMAIVQQAGVVTVTANAHHLMVTMSAIEQIPDLVNALVRAGARIRGLVPEGRTLEEVYLDLIGGS